MSNPEFKLEQKIISAVVQFCREKHKHYSILGKSSESGLERITTITVGKHDFHCWGGLRRTFQHEIVFDRNNGNMVRNSTQSVDTNVYARVLYTDFLDYLKSQKIELENSFHNLWKKNPEEFYMPETYKIG